MSLKKLSKKYTSEELADAFVFRSTLSTEEEILASEQLKLARLKNREKLTDNQRLYASVLQLRFMIEDYLKSDQFDRELSFGNILRKYIALNYKINKQFAADIQLDETELSQLLNNKRMPSEKTIIRLEIHSNNVISAVSWYKLVEKQHEHMLSTDQQLRIQQASFVKNKLQLI
jgi:plasmid maintenance system antidote protein VapI